MLRFPLTLLFVLSTCGLSHAAEPLSLNLWPGKPPGPGAKANGGEQDLSKPNQGLVAGKPVIRLGNVTTPQAHVYLPTADKANGTSVVICPGGGYNILAWDLEGTEVAEWFNTLGVAAIVVKYRVPTGGLPDKPLGPVMDAQRAVSLARSKAAEWKLNPQRIGLLGFSAGGDTAARATLKNGTRAYEASDEIDKASCRPDFAMLIYPAYLVDNATNQLKPDLVVTKQTPPVFFAHAVNDPVKCESSVALFLALRQAGVPSELHIYDRGGHGYGLRPQANAPVTTWPARCAEWLNANGWTEPEKSK